MYILCLTHNYKWTKLQYLVAMRGVDTFVSDKCVDEFPVQYQR